MLKNLTLLCVCANLLFACAGRTPNPIQTAQIGDRKLTCEQLAVELTQLNDTMRELRQEKFDRRARNISFGILGWFFLVPWFFMNFGDAPEVEMTAVQRRSDSLRRIANEKDCT